MSNSVVKVTDSMLNDSLFLLVGEDGIVAPDKNTVESLLKTQQGPTNIQVMQINKSDEQSIDVVVDNVLYLPEADNECIADEYVNVEEVALNLHNIKLDHDYTTHEEPIEEVDELAKTLSILEGTAIEPSLIKPTVVKSVPTTKNKPKSPPKLIKTAVKQTLRPNPKKPKVKFTKEELDDEEESFDEYEQESDENNDSDFELEPIKPRRIKKNTPKPELREKLKPPLPIRTKIAPESPKVEKPQEETLKIDKKTPKKDKKSPKPILDDFALFSTPDIIRRVGGKDGPSTSTELLSSPESKPAKIENRSKSTSETPLNPLKQTRLSLDGKGPIPAEAKKKVNEIKKPKKNIETTPPTNFLINESESQEMDFVGDNLGLGETENNLAIDATGLDLDPTLLDNINNDLISDDILYQVAQSLVSNTELQNAIDKSLNEGDLVLDPGMQEVMQAHTPLPSSSITQQDNFGGGTQIVRPDGRIVLIPPIERPTTRSRNKRRDTKSAMKPLDDEHVSGNELDSSPDEEEESEDDPNKLWCICNQPHNNRFMICCDTCEEWYHGKCVNITKAMGQQMESEGREWICLFCKDPQLNRPQAAARRIRRASRNSRQSSDSTGSSKIIEASALDSVPCVVCQKPARINSVFCSKACILAHAEGVERVVVFERSTGNMLTGNKAPSAVNLEQWLKEHPGYEVVRSAGKVVTTKQQPQVLTQSKLKLVKNSDNDGVSLAIHKKGINMGILKHLPKNRSPLKKPLMKGNLPHLKMISKQAPNTPHRIKVINPPPKSQPSIPSPKVKPPQQTIFKVVTKEKSLPIKTPKARQSESSVVQPKQENIRDNVQKTVFEQLTNRLKLVDDLKVNEEDLKSISTEIESQLYKCFGDTGQKYKNKYRSLIFNIKDIKNQTLWRRICEKSVNPYQLVRLSPDDLASQELALWREREAKHQLDMIKKSELDLLQCNRQYVLKTHKGEEVLEDNRPTDQIVTTEVITSLTEESESTTIKEKTSKHREKESRTKKGESHRHQTSSSKDRSRNNDKSSKQESRKRSRSRGRDRHRKSSSSSSLSHKSSRHKKEIRQNTTDKLDKKSKEILEQLVDNKIVPPLEDKLWKSTPQEEVVTASTAESDSDHEPSSTVTIPTPPRNNGDADEVPPIETKNVKVIEKPIPEPTTCKEIWRGIINMVDVAQISITAHEASGDNSGLGKSLPHSLDIVGRISPDTVWDYIRKMKCSNSKNISLVRLSPVNMEEKMPYLSLYNYLLTRDRFGVVKTLNKAVKDFYIMPLPPQKPIPPTLLPITGSGFAEPRPALLLGIIVRDRRKRTLPETASPILITVKKSKVEAGASTTSRSYTPPPVKDAKLKLPLPPAIVDPDDDEPYSPEDSDPENSSVTTASSTNNTLETSGPTTSQPFQPFTNKFDDIIPGLDSPSLPSSTQEIQRQMEKLNKEIEMQKSEINSISQHIATDTSEIGTSALANIALPSNLQQILDSIKTIGAVSTADLAEIKSACSTPSQDGSDLTIPLMLPTNFSRASSSGKNTIPLNLPKKKHDEKSGSVLSSLTEEDLIRKAEEMLGQSSTLKESNQEHYSNSKNDMEVDEPSIPGFDVITDENM